jgi:hypothetical protein
MQDLYNNYSGFSDYTLPPSPFSTSTSSTSSTSAKFDWGALGNSLLTVGGGIYASEQQRKAAQKQADALIASGMTQIEVQKLILEGKRLDLEAAKAGVVGGKSGSKTLYIALGIGGVLVLGVIIFAVTRKKS